MTRVAWGDATTKCVLAVLAASAVLFVCGSTPAHAARTVSPSSVDFGTVQNGSAGGRLSATVTYSISADELDRYAYNRADGGAPDGSTQFSVGGGNCYSVFPPLPATPASCTIIIDFDYAPSAKGLSTGTLLIDSDANFSTSKDQLIVPLSANLLAGVQRRKCKGSAFAPRKRCGKEVNGTLAARR